MAFLTVLSIGTVLLVPQTVRAAFCQSGPDVDLETIVAAMEWYDTSIQSYRIRYRTVITPDPAGRRYQLKLFEPNAEAARIEEWANKSESQEAEIVRSGDRIRVEIAYPDEEQNAQVVWVYNGMEVRSVWFARDGTVTSGGVAGDITQQQPPSDAPVRAAGVRIIPSSEPLHYVAMREPTTEFKGLVKLEGRQLCEVSVKYSWGSHALFYLDPQQHFLPVRVEETGPHLRNVLTVETFGTFLDQRTQKPRSFPTILVRECFMDGRLTGTCRTETTAFDINPVIPDTSFELPMPDGIFVTDHRTRETRVTGSQQTRREIAEKSVAQARASLEAELARASENQRRIAPSRATLWLAVGIGVPSLALIVGGFLLKRKAAS